jgi:hypothetical protein
MYRPAHGAGKIAKDNLDKVPQFLRLHTIAHLWTLICKRRDIVNEQRKQLELLNPLSYGTVAKHFMAVGYKRIRKQCGLCATCNDCGHKVRATLVRQARGRLRRLEFDDSPPAGAEQTGILEAAEGCP